MKYLKTYEDAKSDPQIGDYVLCKTSYGPNGIDNFLKNTIGVCLGKHYTGENPELIRQMKDVFKIKYDNIPDYLTDYFYYSGSSGKDTRSMRRDEIIHFSPEKEDLETILAAPKYNL